MKTWPDSRHGFDAHDNGRVTRTRQDMPVQKQCPTNQNAHGRAPATANTLRLAMGKIGKNVLQGKILNNKFNEFKLDDGFNRFEFIKIYADMVIAFYQ